MRIAMLVSKPLGLAIQPAPPIVGIAPCLATTAYRFVPRRPVWALDPLGVRRHGAEMKKAKTAESR